MHDLIEMAGLATFRRYERACLERVVAEHEAAVIATAGGIVSSPETYGLLLRRTHTVWIKARPEEHMRRVMAQGDFRPMAQNREAMSDLVAILDARSADYARAQAELDTSGDTAEQSFAKLSEIVKRSKWRVMTALGDQGFLDLGDMRLEYRMIGPRPDAAPTIVMLHEGLGCVGLWGDFPDKLQPATGAGVFVYSRAGYGQSSPATLPRPLTFMHDEARDVLPRLLDAIGFRRGLLLGHSDGASIAAIYAGSVQDHRVRGLVLIAPHFFTEDMGIAAIARAKEATRPPICDKSFRAGTTMSTSRSSAGAAPGSIRISADGTSPTCWPTSACRSWSCRARTISTARSRRSRSWSASATARWRSRSCRAFAMCRIAKRRMRCSRWRPTSPIGCCATTTKGDERHG